MKRIVPVLLRDVRHESRRRADDTEQHNPALEGKRIARFRQSACDALREYLEQHGYLDPRDRLAPEDVRARVLGAVARDIERGLIGVETVDRMIAACMGGAAASSPGKDSHSTEDSHPAEETSPSRSALRRRDG